MTEKEFNEFVKTQFEDWIEDTYIQVLDANLYRRRRMGH